MTSFESESRCRRRATSSRIALQALSTRHGRFLSSENWQVFNWLACGGAGGTSTLTVALQLAVNPRSSLTVAVTVIGPALAPAVSSEAVVPLPVTRPAVVV